MRFRGGRVVFVRHTSTPAQNSPLVLMTSCNRGWHPPRTMMSPLGPMTWNNFSCDMLALSLEGFVRLGVVAAKEVQM
jgi:hypothetical protein